MIALLLLIPIAALLILDYFIADEFRSIAQKKGYCGKKYFWWSFFTGFVGYGMVVALPDRGHFHAAEAPKCPAAETCRPNYC